MNKAYLKITLYRIGQVLLVLAFFPLFHAPIRKILEG